MMPNLRFLSLCLLFVACMRSGEARAQQTVPAGYTGNPILPGYYADPCIIVDKGAFYLYATMDPWGKDSLACFTSTDMQHWKALPLNWPTKAACHSPTSNDSKVWAPSVVKGPDGKFHMFVSVGSEVYAGVSDAPEGPWRNVRDDNGPFIASQRAINVHTIDAEAFVDEDGSCYLYWGSGWNWKDGHCFAGKLNRELNAFEGTPRDITPPNYFEGPYMLKHDGTYFLMYSQGKCTDTSYKVRYSTASSPMGPWKEGAHSPVLATDMHAGVYGPGHHTMLLFKGKYYIIYHRISDPGKKDLLRVLCIDPLEFDAKGDMIRVHPTNKGVPVSLVSMP